LIVAWVGVLLMDEPFAALDALTRGTLQHDLLQLADELKFTLVFVTHSIDEAILIGTRLHLLSAHPGRTITSFDTTGFGADQLGTPAFRALSDEIRQALFGRTTGAAA
jgi:NitT/TauT family transport system ATP-binding protein